MNRFHLFALSGLALVGLSFGTANAGWHPIYRRPILVTAPIVVTAPVVVPAPIVVSAPIQAPVIVAEPFVRPPIVRAYLPPVVVAPRVIIRPWR